MFPYKKTIKISRSILFLSLLWMLLAHFFKQSLPSPQDIHPYLLQAPIQTKITKKPFSEIINQQAYDITPLYDYDLRGLVVSERNFTDSWLFALKFKNDPMNVKDLCVIWGSNLVREDYKHIKFSNGEFTCYAKTPPKINFYPDAISNNHLITANPQIAMLLGEMHRGDQIHIKGQLINYHNLTTGGRRHSSLNRTDTGNGACETLYVSEAKILKSNNLFWEMTDLLAWILFILSFIVWFYFFFIERFFQPVSIIEEN